MNMKKTVHKTKSIKSYPKNVNIFDTAFWFGRNSNLNKRSIFQ